MGARRATRGPQKRGGITRTAAAKYARLEKILKDMGRVLVAYSGGVDSSLLLKAAHDVLGWNAFAATASTEVHTARELREAKETAAAIGVPLRVIRSKILERPAFAVNPPDRCYHCKTDLFSILHEIARKQRIPHIVEGTNADDVSDYRPGLRALEELGVRSPLREAGLGKEEIRALSRRLGLATASRPSRACLASRFPYGTRITAEGLRRVGAAEETLLELGFGQLRVRDHGRIARIEIEPAAFPALLKAGVRDRIIRALRRLGWDYVTLDLAGYRTGSLNEVLRKR